jgi:hypothetical protein
MTDIAARQLQSPRFRRDRPTLERGAGAWLRDFTAAAARPGFSIVSHMEGLIEYNAAGSPQTAVLTHCKSNSCIHSHCDMSGLK